GRSREPDRYIVVYRFRIAIRLRQSFESAFRVAQPLPLLPVNLRHLRVADEQSIVDLSTEAGRRPVRTACPCYGWFAAIAGDYEELVMTEGSRRDETVYRDDIDPRLLQSSARILILVAFASRLRTFSFCRGNRAVRQDDVGFVAQFGERLNQFIVAQLEQRTKDLAAVLARAFKQIKQRNAEIARQEMA